MPVFKDPEKRKLWIERLRKAGKNQSIEVRQKISNTLKGIHRSKKTRKKISKALRGKKRAPLSIEHRRKISVGNKGKHSWDEGLTKETDERVKKMSETKKGKKRGPMSEETKQKLREVNSGENNSNYGKHPSEETKKKRSKSLKGHITTDKTREKISKANTGKHRSDECKKKQSEISRNPSEETRRKMSEAQRGEKSWHWKGGNSRAYQEERAKRGWARIVIRIRKRDGYTCQHCGKYPAYQVHHIIPWRLTHNDDESDLVTLCRNCHGLIGMNTRFVKELSKI